MRASIFIKIINFSNLAFFFLFFVVICFHVWYFKNFLTIGRLLNPKATVKTWLSPLHINILWVLILFSFPYCNVALDIISFVISLAGCFIYLLAFILNNCWPFIHNHLFSTNNNPPLSNHFDFDDLTLFLQI